MNENVVVADDLVAKMRQTIIKGDNKKIVPVSTEDLVSYLHSLERLATLERHLYNLCSNGYKIYA